MKVILTTEVSNLGQAGEVTTVADGYARNYLIPNGLAVKATPGAEKEFHRIRAAQSKREARDAAEAQAVADQLRDVALEFEAKAGETGRLYGSVTPDDIADALRQKVEFDFDRRKHIESDALREVGEHTVIVRLTSDISVDVAVLVKPEGGELPEAPPAEEPEQVEESPAEEGE